MKHKERDRLAAILKELQVSSGSESASELAKKIGIPDQRFRSYMRGQNSAQADSLAKISIFMGITEAKLWEMLYQDDSEIKSATELISLFSKLSWPEQKRFLQLAMEVI